MTVTQQDNKALYHEESTEELSMALMNEGWSREEADSIIEQKAQEAYLEQFMSGGD